jgi:hypothetical protein
MDHEKILAGEVVGALDPAYGSGPSTFAVGFSKYVVGARVPIFGHAAHDPFGFSSTEYVDVPNTYSSSYLDFTGRCRLEVVFATNHDQSIEIRMFDPANPSFPPVWLFEFKGGHAPNSWWNFQVTDGFSLSWRDPWPRQNTLQVRSPGGSPAILGGVVLVVEDMVP